jgi:hypothetical protein
MTYMGRQGDRLDRGVTLRDLQEANLIAIRPAYLNGVDDIPIDGSGKAQAANSSYLSHTESASLTAGASTATYTTAVVVAFKSTGAPVNVTGGAIVHLQSNNAALHNCFISVTLNMDGSDVILAGSGYYVASPLATPTVETTIPIVFQSHPLAGHSSVEVEGGNQRLHQRRCCDHVRHQHPNCHIANARWRKPCLNEGVL